jgi:protein gp37
MSKTKIEWTETTWNPVRGCSRVSPGCNNCYAMRQARRMDHPGGAYEGLTRTTKRGVDWSGEVRLIGDKLREPIRWRRHRHVFVNSMSDLFHEKLSDDDIDCVFGVMWACRYLGPHAIPGHTFQVLTKRPRRMLDYLLQDRRREWADCAVNYGGGDDPDPLWDSIAFEKKPHPRIWLGVTAEDQKRADERIPLLLQCPAAVRFVSVEPMLEPITLRPGQWIPPLGGGPRVNLLRPWEAPGAALSWAIVGAESGLRARPAEAGWFRALRGQCVEAGVPYFLKQMQVGGQLVKMPKLDGRVWAELPEAR